jgi:hypothetical protein
MMPMPQPVLLEGAEAIDAVVRMAAPALAKSWSGDETAVGMVVEQPGGFAVVWTNPERVIADLARRADAEQDPRRRERYRSATAVLSGPRSDGRVSCVVAGWGDLLTIDLEAEDLRLGQQFTAPGGSA